MSSDQLTYLGKDGKTFGPFQDAEIEAMKISGEFYRFEWKFDGSSPEWTRIVPPVAEPPKPPLPPASSGNTGAIAQPTPTVEATRTMVMPSSQKASGAAKSTGPASNRVFQAICHDFSRVMSGKVVQPGVTGGKLVCTDVITHPPFVRGTTVWMDLLEEASDRSVKIKATLTDLHRENQTWVYSVAWDSCPLL